MHETRNKEKKSPQSIINVNKDIEISAIRICIISAFT